MKIENCTRDDFETILREQANFWGSSRALSVHHPMFVEEFGETAFIIRAESKIAAYLFGFFAKEDEYFYVHLVAVRDDMRGKSLGAKLYEHVEQLCLNHGAQFIKAITPPNNKASLRFHRKLGFDVRGTQELEGTRFTPHYSGKGRHMSLLIKQLMPQQR